MKILFINPSGGYYHEYPPLGILYVASYARGNGYSVSFFDQGAFPCGEYHRLLDTVDAFRPEIFAFSLYTTNLNHTYSVIKLLKDRYPAVTLVAGGPHATALPQRTLAECPELDFIIYGEGERTMVELAVALEKGLGLDGVDGIYYRSRDNIVNTKPRQLIEDLNTLPFPAYELSKSFSYQLDPVKKGKRVATLMSSRGCPHHCAFCSKAVFGNTYRRRSPRNVVAEMLYQKSQLNADEVYFMDDLFASDKEWLKGFYNELEKNNIDMPWKCLARVRGLDCDDYLKMKNHGCYVIQFGVESGSDAVLKGINKGISRADCLRAFKEARQAGLNTYGFFIFGHRQDNVLTIKETLEFAKLLNPDFVAFFTLVPFPGTDAYEFIEEKLKFAWERIRYVWVGPRKYLPISICSVDSQDLVRFEADAGFEFYGRLRYLWENVILSRTGIAMKWLKFKYFIYHGLRKIKHLIKGDCAFRIR